MEIERPKVDKYKELNELVLNSKLNKIYNKQSFELITKLLEINPELYTVWNYRKEYLINEIKGMNEINKHEILENELYFVLKQLKKFPKSYWIWNHRIWCLKLDNLSDWENELKLIKQFLTVDSRNFHVWSYRRFIIKCMKDISKDSDIIDFEEFKFTTSMINKDISNYSAWHNRSKLIEMLFNKSPVLLKDDVGDEKLFQYLLIFNNKDINQFLIKELELFKTAIYTDPDDSSVWFYMKWLISEYFLNKIENDEKIDIITKLINDIKELNELEIEDNENGNDNKWCLISIVYLMKQLYKIDKLLVNLDEFNNYLTILQKIDPMKRNRYIELNI